MARYDFSSPRLFVEPALGEGADVPLGQGPANYLRNVLRLSESATVLVFNGRDGEWRARLASPGKRSLHLVLEERLRPQEPLSDLHYLFAPLKQARLDYMVQKAVEMGAGRLVPVLTRHTQVRRVNRERMAANVREAAEQCGIIAVPPVDEPVELPDLLGALEAGRTLVVADEAESAGGRDPLAQLSAVPRRAPVSVLVGPEGGFHGDERALLDKVPGRVTLSLGPRILRADTAGVAALALVQAACGDWRGTADVP